MHSTGVYEVINKKILAIDQEILKQEKTIKLLISESDIEEKA